MNKPLSFLTIACLLSAPALCRAHLGETRSQLIAHFGTVTSSVKDPSADETITFEKPGLLVIGKLVKGKCVALTTTAIGGNFSPAEVQRILNDSAQGKKWTHEKGNEDCWNRSDGAVAYVNPGSVDIVASPAEGQRDASGSVEPKPELRGVMPAPLPIQPLPTPPPETPAAQLAPAAVAPVAPATPAPAAKIPQ